MRIPRTNFPPATSRDGDQFRPVENSGTSREGADLQRQKLVAETTAAEERANWERNFYLAPNVRFSFS